MARVCEKSCRHSFEQGLSKVAVVYFSQTGNTEAMANAVTEGAGTNAVARVPRMPRSTWSRRSSLTSSQMTRRWSSCASWAAGWPNSERNQCAERGAQGDLWRNY